jgi:hypothetical protein
MMICSWKAASAALLVCSAALAQSAHDMYAMTFSGQLIGLNAGTGNGTLIGNTGVNNWETLERDPINGQLLGIGNTNRLYRVNTLTGASTLIGSSNVQWIEAMAWDSTRNTMFVAYSTNNDVRAEQLGTMNLSTGLVTAIGAFGAIDDVDAMAVYNGQIYAANLVGGSFGSVNPLTGAYTTIGNAGDLLGALDFGPDGTLYGTRLGNSNGGGNAQLVRINPATGTSTVVGPTNFVHVDGLVVNIPTPGSMAAILVAGTLASRRRRR